RPPVLPPFPTRRSSDLHRRGVEVRILIDHIGSLGYPGYRELVRLLDSSGLTWRRSLPIRPWRGEYQRIDLRNHRKILVVDGQVRSEEHTSELQSRFDLV